MAWNPITLQGLCYWLGTNRPTFISTLHYVPLAWRILCTFMSPLCTLLLSSLYMLAENTLDFCFIFCFFLTVMERLICVCMYVVTIITYVLFLGVLIILLSLKIICIKSVLYILMFKLLKMYIYLVINVTMEWSGVLVKLFGELSFLASSALIVVYSALCWKPLFSRQWTVGLIL